MTYVATPKTVSINKMSLTALRKLVSKERRARIAAGRKGGLARAKNLSAEELSDIGRKAGQVGGRQRASALSPERRSEIAKKAAAARWAKKVK